MDQGCADSHGSTLIAVRVAFPLIGRGAWTGGIIYLKNTLRLIRSRLTEEIEASVFLSPEENEEHGGELSPLVEGRLIVDPIIGQSGRGKSLARALVMGRDAPLERLLQTVGINSTFEVAGFYGTHFAIPVVSWIPDFQHRHMPEMFSRLNRWRRDLGFKTQIRAGRTLMLSSTTACNDMERFYPTSRGRGHVVRFAIDLDIASHLDRGAEMRQTYDLPDRFYFLPNQFWRHKNHQVILAALAHLRAEGVLDTIPPVILTGQPIDPRNPAHFGDLMRQAKSTGVESHFRYLGLLPYDHVLALNATCERMLNPSSFEGWSTPIEEAKAFATPLVLSDIPIHREQAPDAHFFDARSIDAAAEALLDVARRPPAPRPPAADRVAVQSHRLDAHAASLLGTIRAALGDKNSR